MERNEGLEYLKQQYYSKRPIDDQPDPVDAFVQELQKRTLQTENGHRFGFKMVQPSELGRSDPSEQGPFVHYED